MSAIHDYIERNPDYSSCVSTLEDSSRDNEGNTLTNATCEILNFDDVAEIHMKKHSYKGKFPSVDAFFLTKSGVPYFIEFKYGKNIKSDYAFFLTLTDETKENISKSQVSESFEEIKINL